jgi:hypothetical protein
VNEHERALEHYEIAIKPLQEKKIVSLSPHEQAQVREKARLRVSIEQRTGELQKDMTIGS